MFNQEQLERQWSQDIATTGCATCPIESCQLTFPTISSISIHLQHCSRSPKPHEYVVCELCNKKFASAPMLDDHIFHFHEESRQKIRIRKLDSSIPDCSIRRCVMGDHDEIERRRVTDAPQIFHPIPVEEDVNLLSDSEHQCKQREVPYVRSATSESESSLADCYLPQHHSSRHQYHITKNQVHSRESVNAGPSTYNSPTVVHSYHSTSKQSRRVEYEKQKIHEDVNVFGNTSAFHRIRDRSGSEHLITVPFATESKEPSRFLFEGSNTLYGKDDVKEHLTSSSPCCRPIGQSLRTSCMRKSGTVSPVYPVTSGVKRKYVEQHSYGNVYESLKSRKCGPKVSCNTGYTSDESEGDGRAISNHEPRIRHSPGMRPHPRPCIKTEIYPPGGRSLRRGQTPPFPGYSEKGSMSVFERHSMPDESYFDPNSMMPAVTGCVWDEEGLFTAPVHIKKRQLAERAQQLQRAEEAVKQQEEEAQEHTWRALHEQEMALREKEEALKQREAAAQKKIEEATRLIEESRKLGDTKKFKDEKSFLNTRPTNLLTTNKRSSSSGPFPNCEELGNQLSTIDVLSVITKHNESSQDPGVMSSLVTNESETIMIPCASQSEMPMKMGSSSSAPSITNVTLTNDLQQRQGENHSVISSFIEKSSYLNVNEMSTERQNSTVEMSSPTKCHINGNSKDRNANPWESNDTVPRMEPSKVIKTYSRAKRCHTVKESSETLALSYIQTKACIPPRAHSVAPVTKTSMPTVSLMPGPENCGETVINEGATVTITPLTRAERPPRPCSAMPNLQSPRLDSASDSGILRPNPKSSSVSNLALPVTVTVMLESHRKSSSSMMQIDAPSKAKESPCLTDIQPITPLNIIQPRKALISKNSSKKLPVSPFQEITQSPQQVLSEKSTMKYPGKVKQHIAVYSANKGRKLSVMTLAGVSISGHEKNQFTEAVSKSNPILLKHDKSPAEVDFSSQNTSLSPCPLYVLCNSQEKAVETPEYKNLNLKLDISQKAVPDLSTTTTRKSVSVDGLDIQESFVETVKIKSYESNSLTNYCSSAPSSYNETSSSNQKSVSVHHLPPEPQHVSLSRMSQSLSHSLATDASKPAAKSALAEPNPARQPVKSESPALSPELLTPHPKSPSPLRSPAPYQTLPSGPASPTSHPKLSPHYEALSVPHPLSLIVNQVSPKLPVPSPVPDSPSPYLTSLTSHSASPVPHEASPISHSALPLHHSASLTLSSTSESHPTVVLPYPTSLTPTPTSTPYSTSPETHTALPIVNPTSVSYPKSPASHPSSLTHLSGSPTTHSASPMPHTSSSVPLQASSATCPLLPTHNPASPASFSVTPTPHPVSPTPQSVSTAPHSSAPELHPISASPYPVSPSPYLTSPSSHPVSPSSHLVSLSPLPPSPTPHPVSSVSYSTSLLCHSTELPLPHTGASPTANSAMSHPESPVHHRPLQLHPALSKPLSVSSAHHSSSSVPKSPSLESPSTSPEHYTSSVTHQQGSLSYQDSITPNPTSPTPSQFLSTQSGVHHGLPICYSSTSLSSTPHRALAPYRETLSPLLQPSLPVSNSISPISHPTLTESHQSLIPIQILTASVASQEPEKQVALISNQEVSVPSMISRVSCPALLSSNETQPASQQVQEIQVPQQSAVILQHVTQGPRPTVHLARAHLHQEETQFSHEESQVSSQATEIVQEVMHLSQQGSQMADQLPSGSTNFSPNGTVIPVHEVSEPQILGEYDPLTGTFTSNNPVFLQSILNNSLNFPARCLADNNSSESVSGPMTFRPSSVTPVRRVSVQIQTEDFNESVEVLKGTQKNQDSKNHIDENKKNNDMPYHVQREHQTRKSSNVKQQFINIRNETVENRHIDGTSTDLEQSDTFATELENIEPISAKTECSLSIDTEDQNTHRQRTFGNIEEDSSSAVTDENSSDSEERNFEEFQMEVDEIDYKTQDKNTADTSKKNNVSPEVDNAELNHEKIMEFVDSPIKKLTKESTSDFWASQNCLGKEASTETNTRKVVVLDNVPGTQGMNHIARNEASSNVPEEDASVSDCVFDGKETHIETDSSLLNNESIEERYVMESNSTYDTGLSSDVKKAVVLTNVGGRTYSNMVCGMLKRNSSLEMEKQVKKSEIAPCANRKEDVKVICTSGDDYGKNQDDEVGNTSMKSNTRRIDNNECEYASQEVQNDKDASPECLESDRQDIGLIKVTSRVVKREEDKVRSKVWEKASCISLVNGQSDSLENNHMEKVCSYNHDVNMLDTSVMSEMGKTDETAEAYASGIPSQEEEREVLSVSTGNYRISPLVEDGIPETSKNYEKSNVKKNLEKHYVISSVKVEQPEGEEKVERISRGGRKLKLKDWWTGVVTDATSPRGKSSIPSSIKSTRSKDFSPKLSSFKKGLIESIDSCEGLRNKEKLEYVCQPTDELQRDDNPRCGRDVIGDNLASISVEESNATGISLTPILDKTCESDVVVEGRISLATCDVKPARKRKGHSKAHLNKRVETELPCQPEKEVKCGNCGFLCNSQAHFISHAQLEHNGLARPDGENQEFTEDEIKFILNSTIKAVKRLKCMKCLNMFRSLLGYRRHILACGRKAEELNVNCKICNRQVRYYYLDLHMKKNHERHESKKSEKQGESSKDNDQTASGLRPRRKAAANCNARLQVWRSNRTGECGSDVSDGEDDYHKELNLSQFYSQPKPIIPEECSKKWEADLAFHGKAVCINEGCTFTFATLAKGYKHTWDCPFSTTDKAFQCRLCEFTSITENDIVNHIALNHTDVIGSFEGSDYEMTDDDYEGPRRVQKYYGSVGGLQLRPFSSALNWTMEFLNGTVSERLFSEFVVFRSNWTALDEQIAKKYLPSVRCSPKFKIQMVTSEVNEPVQEWQELSQLNGVVQEKGYAMFFGGSVSASAWCPQSSSFSIDSSKQYLAVSSVSSPERKYHVHKSASHDGLIQIWDCSCHGNSKEPPKFLFGIAHEFGNVWSLVWCPSGIYEISNDDASLENDTLPRLGLLAAACSDGTIRIFSIPQPSTLKLLDSSRIFKALPKLTLSPGEMYKDEAQCLKVDWCRGKGHAYVAGALSTGVVCVWDVSCMSPLLRVNDIKGNFTFYPVNSFLAHNGVCSVVAFCPTTGGRNLLSGGSDRTYKFWDLENTDMPLSITRKGLVLDAVWLPHWAGCFISFDDVYGLTNTNTCFRENGFFGIQSRNVMSSNAPVWSLAGSDWLNAVVQGDSAGEVMITVQQQLFRNYENDKFPSKRKVPLLSVRLQNFSNTSSVSFRVCHDSKQPSTSETSKAKPSKKQKKSRQGQGEKDTLEEDGLCPASFIEWPRTYHETCQNYGVVFLDQNCENFSQIPDAEFTERKRSDYMEPGPVACYPMMAATSIAWNNNISAQTWIFVGTHSGLGRLLNVSALSTPEEERYVIDS